MRKCLVKEKKVATFLQICMLFNPSCNHCWNLQHLLSRQILAVGVFPDGTFSFAFYLRHCHWHHPIKRERERERERERGREKERGRERESSHCTHSSTVYVLFVFSSKIFNESIDVDNYTNTTVRLNFNNRYILSCLLSLLSVNR